MRSNDNTAFSSREPMGWPILAHQEVDIAPGDDWRGVRMSLVSQGTVYDRTL